MKDTDLEKQSSKKEREKMGYSRKYTESQQQLHQSQELTRKTSPVQLRLSQQKGNGRGNTVSPEIRIENQSEHNFSNQYLVRASTPIKDVSPTQSRLLLRSPQSQINQKNRLPITSPKSLAQQGHFSTISGSSFGNHSQISATTPVGISQNKLSQQQHGLVSSDNYKSNSNSLSSPPNGISQQQQENTTTDFRLLYEAQKQKNAATMLEMMQQSNNSLQSYIQESKQGSIASLGQSNEMSRQQIRNPANQVVSSPSRNEGKSKREGSQGKSGGQNSSSKSNIASVSQYSLNDLTKGWNSPKNAKQSPEKRVKKVRFSSTQSRHSEKEASKSSKMAILIEPPKVFEESFSELLSQFNRLIQFRPNDIIERQEFEDLLSLVRKEKQIVSSDIKYLTHQRDKYKDIYSKKSLKGAIGKQDESTMDSSMAQDSIALKVVKKYLNRFSFNTNNFFRVQSGEELNKLKLTILKQDEVIAVQQIAIQRLAFAFSNSLAEKAPNNLI